MLQRKRHIRKHSANSNFVIQMFFFQFPRFRKDLYFFLTSQANEKWLRAFTGYLEINDVSKRLFFKLAT